MKKKNDYEDFSNRKWEWERILKYYWIKMKLLIRKVCKRILCFLELCHCVFQMHESSKFNTNPFKNIKKLKTHIVRTVMQVVSSKPKIQQNLTIPGTFLIKPRLLKSAHLVAMHRLNLKPISCYLIVKRGLEKFIFRLFNEWEWLKLID